MKHPKIPEKHIWVIDGKRYYYIGQSHGSGLETIIWQIKDATGVKKLNVKLEGRAGYADKSIWANRVEAYYFAHKIRGKK